MALTTNQKKLVRQALHRAYSSQELPIAWSKAEADADITNADGWVDDNGASYASSLTGGFGSSSSASDKSILLICIAIGQRLASEPAYIGVLRSVLTDLESIQGA